MIHLARNVEESLLPYGPPETEAMVFGAGAGGDQDQFVGVDPFLGGCQDGFRGHGFELF